MSDTRLLMMATAAVLVAAVSIGVTLAYLTATTPEKVNNFTANTDALQGVLDEPKFTANKTNVRPGDKYDKDPLVENLTTTDSMWTGIKMTFKINGIIVPYSTFKQYVALYSDSDPTATERYLDSGTDMGYTDDFSSDWTNVTSNTTNSSGALYFVYNTKLTENDNNGVANHTETYTNNGTDTTTPIFKHVYLNPNITVVSATNGSPTIRSATADASAYLGTMQNLISHFLLKNTGCLRI